MRLDTRVRDFEPRLTGYGPLKARPRLTGTQRDDPTKEMRSAVGRSGGRGGWRAPMLRGRCCSYPTGTNRLAG